MTWWSDAWLTGFIQDRYYGNLDEERLSEFEFVYSLPFAREYIDMALDAKQDELYMKRYGIKVSDIKDPRKLKQVASAAALERRTLNFISSNVGRLYR